MDNIQFSESGLKCDNTNCDWTDKTIPFEDMESHINKKCPKCGENVLTESDYLETVKLMEIVKTVNAMSEEEIAEYNKLINPDNSLSNLLGTEIDPEALYSMSVETHGGLKVTGLQKLNKIKQLSFEKDPDGRWYVILPEWPGDREALEMVAGADTFLDILAQGENLVHTYISKEDFSTSKYELTKTEETPEVGGAMYLVNGNNVTNLEMWLCDVTRFVYDGEMPEVLYFS